MVEGLFAAFQRGDLEGAFASTVADVEFDNRTEAPGAEGVWHGREGFLAMMGRVTEAFSEYSVELVESREQGNEVTLKVLESGRGRTSGIELSRHIYLTYTVRDGRVVAIRAELRPPAGY